MDGVRKKKGKIMQEVKTAPHINKEKREALCIEWLHMATT